MWDKPKLVARQEDDTLKLYMVCSDDTDGEYLGQWKKEDGIFT